QCDATKLIAPQITVCPEDQIMKSCRKAQKPFECSQNLLRKWISLTECVFGNHEPHTCCRRNELCR
ncbi:unnamed protein product, partial [Mesorhabditis belari]|uniref:Uncharacterized protein n=1 Tax=Mesorhabditis belari TaxID=2138241 RepID=A0AAF3J8I4_9BILA